MAVPPRPISPSIQYSGPSAASAAGLRSLLIAGCRTGRGTESSASGRRSVCVESQHHFAQLDAVAIGELALAVEVRQLLVVDYYRIGLRKIRHGPLSASVGEAGVLTANRARVERNVLRRAPRVPAEDELRLLPLDANEPDLLVPLVTRDHLEVTRQELHDLVRRTDEAHCLARRGDLTVTVDSDRDARLALGRWPAWLAGRRRRRRRSEARRRLRVGGLPLGGRHARLPVDPRAVHREHERDGGIGNVALGAPPSVEHGSRSGHCEEQDGDDEDQDGDGMRVTRSRTLAASTTKARDVPRPAGFGLCIPTPAGTSRGALRRRRARSYSGSGTGYRARATDCENPAADDRRFRSRRVTLAE